MAVLNDGGGGGSQAVATVQACCLAMSRVQGAGCGSEWVLLAWSDWRACLRRRPFEKVCGRADTESAHSRPTRERAATAERTARSTCNDLSHRTRLCSVNTLHRTAPHRIPLLERISRDSAHAAMDAIQNDLAQVRAKSATLLVKDATTAAAPPPPNSSSFPQALDSLIAALEQAREQCTPTTQASDLAPSLQAALQHAQAASAARTKEYYNALVRMGRDLDKKFPTSLDGIADRQLFSSVASRQALDHAVVQHLMRAGEWHAADVLMTVSICCSFSAFPPPPLIQRMVLRALNGPCFACLQAEQRRQCFAFES